MVTGSLCLPVYLEGETRQVTLWRKPGGFGVHLSGGLPPIVVTYVEPGVYIQLCGFGSLLSFHSLAVLPLPPTGGEGEAAGVCVGDVVLKVNGQDCREGVAGVATVMALKMLIQQVKHSSWEKAGSWVSETISHQVPFSLVNIIRLPLHYHHTYMSPLYEVARSNTTIHTLA